MLELSLKPQKSSSWLYSTTSNYTNFIADGIIFNSYNNTTNLTYEFPVNTSIVEALIIAPATANWQGYHQSGLTYLSPVPNNDGNVRNNGFTAGFTSKQFCGVVSTYGGDSGMYQKVYGLQNGSSYTITAVVMIPTGVDSDSEITVGDNVSDYSETYDNLTAGTVEVTSTFVASGSTATVFFNLFSKAAECFDVTSMRVTEHYSEVDLTFSNFEDGSVILDLYDEHIPLTISLSSFTDAASNTQSYSKDFKLPSTKNNDKIFTHIYDLNTSLEDNPDGFNPYIKTSAILKEDGVELFSGELTLNSINKNSEGIQYDVNLQSRTSGLADALKLRSFADIDFDELNHEYTRGSITGTWYDYAGCPLLNSLSTTSYAYDSSIGVNATNVIKYPFVNWTGDIRDQNQDGNLSLENLEEAFRPFIQIKYILNRIFSEVGFTYESKFFESDHFTKLFMDFNHGGINGASPNAADFGGGAGMVGYTPNGDWLTPNFTRFKFNDLTPASAPLSINSGVAAAYWDTSTNQFNAIVDGTSVHFYGQMPCFNDSNIARGIQWRTIHEKSDGTKEVIHTDADTIPSSPLGDPNKTYSPNVHVTMAVGDSVYFEAKTDTSSSNKVRLAELTEFSGWLKFVDITSESTQMKSILNESRGDINQWDFLKDLVNMFNLLISPSKDSDNHLIIEPYDSVFGDTSYGDVLNHPRYSLEGNYSEEYDVTASYSLGRMVLDSSTSTNSSNAGAIGQYHRYVHGETYTLKFDIHSINNGGAIQMMFHDGDNTDNARTAYITTAGEHSFTFVFDQNASQNNTDQLRVRIRMVYDNTIDYVVVFNSISVEGMNVNEKIEKDWSHKVDTDSFGIKIMDLDSKVNFNHVKDDDDYCSNVYSDSIVTESGDRYKYGDLEYSASAFTNLDSVSNISNKVFASTIVKPLNDYSAISDFITPAIYKGNDDGLFTVYKNKPRILYNNGRKTITGSFTSPPQNGDPAFESNNHEYLLFTNFSEFDLITGAPANAIDLNFGQCSLVEIASSSPNTLFNKFWGSYYDELYHVDTRIYTVNVLLNNNDLSNFEFNNVIVIENSKFRVNNINYNSKGMSKVELIKIN